MAFSYEAATALIRRDPSPILRPNLAREGGGSIDR